MRLRGSDLLEDEARGGPEPRVEAREGGVSERERRVEEVCHVQVLALLLIGPFIFVYRSISSIYFRVSVFQFLRESADQSICFRVCVSGLTSYVEMQLVSAMS